MCQVPDRRLNSLQLVVNSMEKIVSIFRCCFPEGHSCCTHIHQRAISRNSLLCILGYRARYAHRYCFIIRLNVGRTELRNWNCDCGQGVIPPRLFMSLRHGTARSSERATKTVHSPAEDKFIILIPFNIITLIPLQIGTCTLYIFCMVSALVPARLVHLFLTGRLVNVRNLLYLDGTVCLRPGAFLFLTTRSTGRPLSLVTVDDSQSTQFWSCCSVYASASSFVVK